MTDMWKRARFAFFIGLSIGLSAGPTWAAPPVRQVLVLQSFDRGNLAFDGISADLHVGLEQRSPVPVNFVQVVVSPTGFVAPPDSALLDFLHTAFAERPQPDLIVTIGGPAGAFARTYRQQLFPESPLLFAAVDERFLRDAPLGPRDATVSVINDPSRLVEDVLQLFPDTTSLFMITGAGAYGGFWRQEVERDLHRFGARLTCIWSTDLSFPEILQQSRNLPAHTAILYLTFNIDGHGAAYPDERVLTELRKTANAPVFAPLSAYVGSGIVGGTLMSTDALGQRIAEAAIRVLNGDSPTSVRPAPQPVGPPVFDARELRRWRVDERRLPPGSLVRFREPSAWEQYRWAIVAAVAGFALQSLLIAALVTGRVRQRHAERSLRESEARFRLLADSAPVMIWMAGTDARCTDFNRPWLAFTGRSLAAELGEGWAEGVHEDDLASCLDTYREAFAQREPFRMEYRLRRCDNEYRWLLDNGQPRFTPDGLFAGYIGTAIDITDLKTARAALSNLGSRLLQAQEQERTRLARELHDDISQRMAFLTMDLSRLSQLPVGESAEARTATNVLHDQAMALSRDIQAISHRLHSSKLDYLGLGRAAESFCREISGKNGVDVEYVQRDMTENLPGDVALNLFRVLQEALSNAVKHSGALHYHVTLTGTPDHVVMEIVDDGCGFDVGTAMAGRGLGLVSMQERLKLIDGMMVIDSKLGRGTRVRTRAPIRQKQYDVQAAADAGVASV